MTPVIHVAGLDITVDTRLRQRCGWCGATLIDEDLAQVMVPEGTDRAFPRWPVGELVAVDGAASWTVPYTPGEDLPEGFCATLDPDVTT